MRHNPSAPRAANYVQSWYIAEFFNTLTSVPIFLFGFLGVVHGLRQGYRARFLVPLALFALVGAGSMAFHGTLLYVGQAMDELPMIWGAAALLFSVVETKPAVGRWWLAPALVAYCVAFTAAYLLTPDLFVYFLLSYIALILSIFFGSLAYYRRIEHAGAKRMLAAAAVLYLGGFFLFWLPDKLACANVQRFQFHALFHLTSSIGPWMLLMHVIFAYHALVAEADAPAKTRTRRGAAAAAAAGEPTLIYIGSVLPVVDLPQPKHE